MAKEKVRVKLTSARAGHLFDSQGRQAGIFAQAAGDIVEMDADEAQRHFDRGLATPAPQETKRG